MEPTKVLTEQPTLPDIDLDVQVKLRSSRSKNGSVKQSDDDAAPLNLGKAISVPVPDFSNPPL